MMKCNNVYNYYTTHVVKLNLLYSTHRDENENVHPITYYSNNFIFIGPSGT